MTSINNGSKLPPSPPPSPTSTTRRPSTPEAGQSSPSQARSRSPSPPAEHAGASSFETGRTNRSPSLNAPQTSAPVKACYPQSHTNSCGAVSLMCAAKELGVNKLPALTTGDAHPAAKNWDGSDFVVSPRTENALYWVTSNKTMKDYSMPHDVVTGARLLGLQGEVHMEPGVTSTLLKAVYPDAVEKTKGSGIPMHTTPVGNLRPEQRELMVVRTMGIGLHYVMRRPDGSFMDPADGKNHPDFNALNTGAKLYSKTGISIVVSNPALRPQVELQKPPPALLKPE